MIDDSLQTLLYRHRGKVAVVVGSGASCDRFPFSVAANSPDTIQIRLNRAIAFPGLIPTRTYWMVQDQAWEMGVPGDWERWIDWTVGAYGMATGVYMDPMYGPNNTRPRAPFGNHVVRWRGPMPDETLPDILRMTREQCAAENRLYTFCGTACTSVHLAWLMGCRSVLMVGCDGDGTVAQGLKQYYDRPVTANHSLSRITAIETAGRLGMPIVFFDPDQQEVK